MKTNRERGYYIVEYECINCGDKIERQVEFGKPIPVLSEREYLPYNLLAPECETCGCRHWRYGKVKK